MRILKLKPEKNELYKLNEFIHEEIPDCDFQIELMVEEIFINIVNYSKCIEITVKLTSEHEIEFIDDGIEFNPLEHEIRENPENIDEAKIGGLGIPFIKEIADEITYKYEDKRNHLIVFKNVR